MALSNQQSDTGAAANGGLVDLFRKQCEAHPDAIAVQDNDGAYSYRELDRRSGELAFALRQQGIGPGAVVGICLERGRELGVAVLGVIKAGAAYVPLDASYPRSRLQFMLGDSAAALVLTSTHLRHLFTSEQATMLLEGLSAPADGEVLEPEPDDPQGITYIIYTSGSTGTPKGVAMPQRALANLIQWQLDQASYATPAKVLQFTPLSFDVHFQEFFGTWACGGSLYFIGDELRRDPSALLAFISEHGIERIFLPFVAMQQLLETAVNYGPMPDSLREITTAGEQLQITPGIAAFFKQRRECRLHNHYGPSETHVVTACTLSGDPEQWPALPPIGTPVSNCRLHLLDDSGQAVSPGDSGELFVSGTCLAAGYWQRPELTAARFIDHGSQRLYRTGDLARQDADGNYHYLGRVDGQVKIRGHRVETGEVENAILQHREVSECAVVASEASGGERKLLAYLVLDAKPEGRHDPRQKAQLAQWQDIWEGTYQQPEHGSNPRFDTSGWNSSFSGHPLPEEEMAQWVAGTVARVQRYAPGRVLEIGAGTGLILFALAPHCEYYHATDYSAASIAQLQQALAQSDDIPAELRASQLAAEDMLSLAGEAFDTVVINSVTQHLVSVDYLRDVVIKAVQMVSERGRVFVGDVTAMCTRELFFTELECARAAPSDTSDMLRSQIQRRLGEEQELVIDPGFFYQLGLELASVTNVVVQLKPGNYDNELSHYRYDVVLEVDSTTEHRVHAQQEWLDWQPDMGPRELLAAIAASDGATIGVRGIPNRRLAYPAALQANLAGDEYPDAEALAKSAHSTANGTGAVHPDDFHSLEQSGDYRVQTLWSEQPASFDLLLSRSDAALFAHPPVDRDKSLQAYASQPFNSTALPSILNTLRGQLEQHLPDYMWPARYIPLQKLPLTPSGKLDRRALPEPSTQRPALEQEYVAPRGELETRLGTIWCQLLELDQVGVNDNFFELGGNSILSLRLGLELRSQLGREVAVVTLFQYPTIRSLAAHLETGPGDNQQNTAARSRAAKQKQAFARGKRLGKAARR